MTQRCDELVLRTVGGLHCILFPLNQALAFAHDAVRLLEREADGVDLLQSAMRQRDRRAAIANASCERGQRLHWPHDAIASCDREHEAQRKGGERAETHEPSGSRRAPQHDLARHREADRPVAAERRTLKRGERIPSFHRETAKPALLRALTLGAECRRRRLSGRTRRHTGDKAALAVDETRDPALRYLL